MRMITDEEAYNLSLMFEVADMMENIIKCIENVYTKNLVAETVNYATKKT